MKYCKSYCEEKEISTSKLNEAQKTLYYIAENLKMDTSISEEGYKHFQTAIKALEQEPKSEWEHDHELLKAYSDGANAMLDKIRKEILDTLYVDSLIFGELFDFRIGMISADDVIDEFNRVTRLEVLKILDKYKAEREG